MPDCPAFPEDGLCRWVEGAPRKLKEGEYCKYYKEAKDSNGNDVAYCSYSRPQKFG